MKKPQVKKKFRYSHPTTRISVIVINANKEILLVRHRKGSRLYWVLPGGRLEVGETFQECGIREIKEETNLDIQIDKFVFLSEAIAPDRSRHIVNIYLTAHVTGGTIQVGDDPVLAGVEFVPLSELEKHTLYPPVGRKIIEAHASNFGQDIQYLGNLWV